MRKFLHVHSLCASAPLAWLAWRSGFQPLEPEIHPDRAYTISPREMARLHLTGVDLVLVRKSSDHRFAIAISASGEYLRFPPFLFIYRGADEHLDDPSLFSHLPAPNADGPWGVQIYLLGGRPVGESDSKAWINLGTLRPVQARSRQV